MERYDSTPSVQALPPGTYRSRWMDEHLRKLLTQMPVVVLTGARQVGKTTLLRHLAAEFRAGSPDAAHGGGPPAAAMRTRYLTLDDLSLAQQARSDPASLWAGYDVVIIDEVQREPGLLRAVKAAVDEGRWQAMAQAPPESTLAPDGSPGSATRFVLSGSANLLLMRQVAESLAGRAGYLVLRPFALGELLGQPPPIPLLEALLRGELPAPGLVTTPGTDAYAYISRGLMPGLYSGPALVDPHVWWDGYVTTYLERDLRDLAAVSSLIDFHRVMQTLALRTGRLLNQAEVARDTATSTATLSRWLNLIETGHLAQRLPAYFSNRGQRLLKMTRLFWVDAALPAFLSGLQADGLEASREAGPLFENLVYHHLSVLAGLLEPPARLYHWRTQRGEQVDFVLEWGQSLVAFEVKSSHRVAYDDAKGLRAFMAANDRCQAGVVLHRGSEVTPLGSRVVAVPWEMVR